MKIKSSKVLFFSDLGYFSVPLQQKQNQAITAINNNQGADNLQ